MPYAVLMPLLPVARCAILRLCSCHARAPQVLTHLAKKRPVTVDRAQFFAHADAFAALVKLGFVQVDGEQESGWASGKGVPFPPFRVGCCW